MLEKTKPFSSFSVNDLEKARDFYGKTLGLEVKTEQEGLELHFPENRIFIYPKENHVPASFTILNFPVRNIEAAVANLSRRGVQFEKYRDGELQNG